MSASNSVVRRDTRVTYSDMPIRVAERQISEVEFINEIAKQAESKVVGPMINELVEHKNACYYLLEEKYSFNEILKKGSVYLTFSKSQLLDAALVGLNSMQFLSAKLMMEQNVNFDLKIDGSKIKFDNHEGIFAVLFDGRRRVKATVVDIVLEDNIDGGITMLVHCLNPYFQAGTADTLLLMIFTSIDKQAVKPPTGKKSKKKSLKRFRQTYAQLDAIDSGGVEQTSLVKFKTKLKTWFSKNIVEMLSR